MGPVARALLGALFVSACASAPAPVASNTPTEILPYHSCLVWDGCVELDRANGALLAASHLYACTTAQRDGWADVFAEERDTPAGRARYARPFCESQGTAPTFPAPTCEGEVMRACEGGPFLPPSQ